MQKLTQWSLVAVIGTVPGCLAGCLGGALELKYGWNYWPATAISLSVMVLLIGAGLLLICRMFADLKGTAS